MVFSLSSQQQTDTQERMEGRQLGLVTSDGEVQREGGGRRALKGSMTESYLQLYYP